jgi:hypothetical protein
LIVESIIPRLAKIGNGTSMVTTKIGKKRLTLMGPNGSEIVLHDCKLGPNLWVNLFSLTQSTSKNWKLSNEGIHITLTKEKFRIVFDEVIKANNGHVNGLELVPVPNVANLTLERGTVVDINNFQLATLMKILFIKWLIIMV